MLFFSKKRTPDQPHPDWPWTLSVGGELWPNFDNWEMVVSELRELYPDNDSFVILEQKDPKNDKNYWYIQSAIALAGPDQGKYTIGVGYGSGDKRAYLERHVLRVEDVLSDFRLAYQGKPINLSAFKDQSDLLF